MKADGFDNGYICAHIQKRRNVALLPKDISNIYQRSWNGKTKEERLVEQIQRMRDDGFTIHLKKGPNDVMRLALLVHKDAAKLIKRFGEVLVTDSTYMTNDLHLPVLNIVGFTNLGHKCLSTFVAASAIMVSEAATNYTWILEKFKETIWNGEPYNTKVNFITAYQSDKKKKKKKGTNNRIVFHFHTVGYYE